MMIPLKGKDGWDILLVLRLKIVSCTCLLGSGLNLIFQLFAQTLVLIKSFDKTLTVSSLSRITEMKDVSSAIILALGVRPLGFAYMSL